MLKLVVKLLKNVNAILNKLVYNISRDNVMNL